MATPIFPAIADLGSELPSVAEIIALGQRSAFRPMTEAESFGFAGASADALILEHAGWIFVADLDEDCRFRMEAHRFAEGDQQESFSWTFRYGQPQIWERL